MQQEINNIKKPATMLFQIQHDQICCINLQKNIGQFNRKFKDIAHCTQVSRMIFLLFYIF